MLPNEGEFDPNAFQAQIDFSLSLTQDLVSSWLHPSYKGSKNAKITDKELEEYIRQPPRLGVGASAPQGYSSNVREAARLKGRITASSKKRGLEELERQDNHDGFDETEENKGVRSAKNNSVDPFKSTVRLKRESIGAVINSVGKFSSIDELSKKNQEQEMTETSLQRDAGSKFLDTSEKECVDNNNAAFPKSPSPLIPSKKEKTRNRKMKILVGPGETVRPGDTNERRIQVDGKTQTSLNDDSENSTEEEEWSGISPDEPLTEHAASQTIHNEPSRPLKRPNLLNLDGHSSGSYLGMDENNIQYSNKKRKRRRKKKH